MDEISLYINALFWGKPVVILIQYMSDVIFFLASRKSKYQKAICCWGGAGEAPEATQGTAASIWRALAGGSHGVLLVLTNFVFLQMPKKLFDRKLSNDLQKLHALKQLPQGLVRALLDEEAPVTLLMLQVPPAQTASGRASAKI